MAPLLPGTRHCQLPSPLPTSTSGAVAAEGLQEDVTGMPTNCRHTHEAVPTAAGIEGLKGQGTASTASTSA